MSYQFPDHHRGPERSPSPQEYQGIRFSAEKGQQRNRILDVLRKGGDMLMMVVAIVGVSAFMAMVCGYALVEEGYERLMGPGEK